MNTKTLASNKVNCPVGLYPLAVPINGHKLNGYTHGDIGDGHLYGGLDTPLKTNAFEFSDTEKKQRIALLFREIMDEIFSGLNPKYRSEMALFNNQYQYKQMLVPKNITFYTNCEHHFVPITGKAPVAYISSGKVIGLSKLNRTVQYYANRPQARERFTNQIAEGLKTFLGTQSIAVNSDAKHLCASYMGIKDEASTTITSYYGGKFNTTSKIAE